MSISMKPKINKTDFGSITIEKKEFDFDVIINLDGQVKKRKKKLSKNIYGTSHIISLDEAKYVYKKGANDLIIGAGQNSQVSLSKEAVDYFKRKKCTVSLFSTPEAMEKWNSREEKKTIGLFHITCWILLYSSFFFLIVVTTDSLKLLHLPSLSDVNLQISGDKEVR